MKTFVLLLALVAYVSADGAHHGSGAHHTSGAHHASGDHHSVDHTKVHHAPAPAAPTSSYSGPAPSVPAAPQPHHAPAPAAPVNHGTYSAPAAPAAPVDSQGYYYYYYPVQNEKTKGVFDFKKYDIATIVIVGIVVVGVALLGLSLFSVTTARSMEPITISYDEMFDMAKTVYDALSKKY